MIIRLTVNDSDFTQTLVKYLNNKVFNLTLDLMDKVNAAEEKLEENRKDEKLLSKYKNAAAKFSEAESKLKEIFGVNASGQLTTEEKEFLKDRLITSFDYYCKRYNKPESLIGQLKVKITDTLTDKDENGEVMYWLQTSNVIVIQ